MFMSTVQKHFQFFSDGGPVAFTADDGGGVYEVFNSQRPEA